MICRYPLLPTAVFLHQKPEHNVQRSPAIPRTVNPNGSCFARFGSAMHFLLLNSFFLMYLCCMSASADRWNIVRHLTVLRVWNMLQLYLSFWLSRLFKKALVFGQPYSCSIEPTTACNLGCPECPSGLKQFTRPTGRLSIAQNQHILDELGKRLFYVNYYFQGEPFLNPDMLSFVREAKKRNIYTATSTNAHFITSQKALEIVDSGLDRLIISIDGLTQETYENYRVHGKLSKVLEGTKHLVDAKKQRNASTPHLIFQFLVVRANEHEVHQVFELAADMGVDEVRIKTAQVYDYENGNPLLPENEKYSRYVRMKDGRYRLKGETGNHCWRMWSSCVFTWDARVVPCCFDKDAQFQLGSAENFTEVWKSKPYQDFRTALLIKRQSISICNNCSEGSKVWA
jgi:MoaA/NifB/PqqE/SkfB family radical SAM enzyme